MNFDFILSATLFFNDSAFYGFFLIEPIRVLNKFHYADTVKYRETIRGIVVYGFFVVVIFVMESVKTNCFFLLSVSLETEIDEI